MKKNQFLNIFIAAAVLASGCQSNFFKSKPTLFANYYVRYSQDGTRTRAEVGFFEGDSVRTAEPKAFSSVFFQQGAMNPKRISARTLRYEAENSVDYPNTFSFRYKRENSKSEEEKQDLTMSALREFAAENGVVSKTKGVKLNWKDDALAEGEGLVLLFSDKNGATAEVALSGPTSATEASVGVGNRLQNFAEGEGGKLALVKKQIRRGQESKKQWVTQIEFYTKTIAVTIVE